VHQALGSAIKRPLLTSLVFNGTDTVATPFLPGGCFPKGLVPAWPTSSRDDDRSRHGPPVGVMQLERYRPLLVTFGELTRHHHLPPGSVSERQYQGAALIPNVCNACDTIRITEPKEN
jgi:hypothetical protein